MTESVLNQIIAKLKQSCQDDNSKGNATSIFTLTKTLEFHSPTIEDFQSFLYESHDILISGDSSKRCSILRSMRYCVNSCLSVSAIVKEQIHWAVVTSLERDADCAVERMQALKLMEKVRIVAPDLFPIAFARSLVAVANSKDDNLRKYSIETLRALSIVNPNIVSIVDGFVPLMDAIIEPINQNMADSILLSMLYLLNDPYTRY